MAKWPQASKKEQIHKGGASCIKECPDNEEMNYPDDIFNDAEEYY